MKKFSGKLSLKIDQALVRLEDAKTEQARAIWSKRLAGLSAKVPLSNGVMKQIQEGGHE